MSGESTETAAGEDLGGGGSKPPVTAAPPAGEPPAPRDWSFEAMPVDDKSGDVVLAMSDLDGMVAGIRVTRAQAREIADLIQTAAGSALHTPARLRAQGKIK